MLLVLREVKAKYQLRDLWEQVNHLLFMDDLKLYSHNEKQIVTIVNTVQNFSKDIRMRIGITMCLPLIKKRCIISRSEGVQLPMNDVI